MKKITKLSIVLLIGLLVFTGCSDDSDKKLDKDSDKGTSIQEDKDSDKGTSIQENKDSDKETDVQENEDSKVLHCSKSGEVTTGVEADLTYEVTYTGSYVDSVHTVEKLKSDNEQYLNQYKTLVEAGYAPYKGLKYYDYDVQVKDGMLTSTVDINYAKIDTDKMIEIDANNSVLIKDGKIKLSDIQSMYESIGAVCE